MYCGTHGFAKEDIILALDTYKMPPFLTRVIYLLNSPLLVKVIGLGVLEISQTYFGLRISRGSSSLIPLRKTHTYVSTQRWYVACAN